MYRPNQPMSFSPEYTMDIKRAIIKHVSDPLVLVEVGRLCCFPACPGTGGKPVSLDRGVTDFAVPPATAVREHAYRRCPYYREQFQTLGLSPEEIRSIADLRLLPVLEKQDIQERFEMMVAEGWPRDDLTLDHTGGSTGAPIAFYSTRERRCWGKAATRRHNAWAGCEIGDRVAYVWGAPRDLPSHTWRSRLVSALPASRFSWIRAILTSRRWRRFRKL